MCEPACRMAMVSSGCAMPRASNARAPSSSGVSETHSTSLASWASNAFGCFVPSERMCGDTAMTCVAARLAALGRLCDCAVLVLEILPGSRLPAGPGFHLRRRVATDNPVTIAAFIAQRRLVFALKRPPEPGVGDRS